MNKSKAILFLTILNVICPPKPAAHSSVEAEAAEIEAATKHIQESMKALLAMAQRTNEAKQMRTINILHQLATQTQQMLYPPIAALITSNPHYRLAAAKHLHLLGNTSKAIEICNLILADPSLTLHIRNSVETTKHHILSTIDTAIGHHLIILSDKPVHKDILHHIFQPFCPQCIDDSPQSATSQSFIEHMIHTLSQPIEQEADEQSVQQAIEYSARVSHVTSVAPATSTLSSKSINVYSSFLDLKSLARMACTSRTYNSLIQPLLSALNYVRNDQIPLPLSSIVHKYMCKMMLYTQAQYLALHISNPLFKPQRRNALITELGALNLFTPAILRNFSTSLQEARVETVIPHKVYWARKLLPLSQDAAITLYKTVAPDDEANRWWHQKIKQYTANGYTPFALSQLDTIAHTAELNMSRVHNTHNHIDIRLAAAKALGDLGFKEKEMEAYILMANSHYTTSNQRLTIANALLAFAKSDQRLAAANALCALGFFGKAVEAYEHIRLEAANRLAAADALHALGSIDKAVETYEFMAMSVTRPEYAHEHIRLEAANRLSFLSTSNPNLREKALQAYDFILKHTRNQFVKLEILLETGRKQETAVLFRTDIYDEHPFVQELQNDPTGSKMQILLTLHQNPSDNFYTTVNPPYKRTSMQTLEHIILRSNSAMRDIITQNNQNRR